jgi:hypothetical protein
MLHEHAPLRGGVESRDTILRISRLVHPAELQIVRDKTACLKHAVWLHIQNRSIKIILD